MTLVNNYGAASTYVKVASTTLTATTSSITFANIPQGYTDLRVVVSGNQYTSASYGDHVMRYNSDSGSNYSNYGMYSNTTQGSSPVGNFYNTNTTSLTLGKMVDFNAGSNTWVSHTAVDILSYSNTTAYKTCLVSNSMIQSGDYSFVGRFVNTWRNTGAITAISIHAITDPPFNVGVTVNIYGIKAALFPKATGGDVVVNDGTYWYHAFRSTGTFVPNSTLSCDALVIAGGGSGGTAYGNQAGGGGGAGGYQLFTSQSISTPQTVIVGAGGAGVGTSTLSAGVNGSNSQFGSLTASVGGGRGGSYSTAPGIGGSGGGGGNQGSNRTGAAATSGQGFAGGTGNVSHNLGAGGGGGAGAVGSDGSTANGGNGGVGKATEASWLYATGTGVSGYIAAGGGGTKGADGSVNGTGGSGGGGAGNSNADGLYGTVNTGSGGGGAYGDVPYYTSGVGGSGLIIVRYPI